MPTNILMPALSPTMEKGNLAKWLKKEGDPIKSGDVIAEIETDKATMEVEAVDEGVLAKITVPEGTADVPVNQIIGLIAAEGEDPKTVSGAGGGQETAPPATAPRPPPAAPLPSPIEIRGAPAEPPDPATAPKAQLAYAKVDEAPDGPAKSAAIGRAAPAPNGADHGPRVFASPLARRIATEGGIDIARVQGSGPHGRIVQADVRAAIADGSAGPASAADVAVKSGPAASDVAAARPSAPAPASQVLVAAPATATPAATPTPAISDEQIKRYFEPGAFDDVPHDSMRKTIARRLAASMQATPHFYLTVDCDLEALLALREQLNDAAPKDRDGKPAYKLSVNDLMIKAHALALMQVPAANVSWTEGSMLRHHHVDVGVAVAIPDGLITPIVRKADVTSLSGISNAMKDFGARAKARKLKPTEYEGGSTALSNLGMFGIKQFTAIINPPHSTILAVGAGEKRVIVRKDQPVVATVMSATLSCDHRAIDGALGAQVIAAFQHYVETPMTMLV